MSSFLYFKTLAHSPWNEHREISNAAVATTITLRTPVSGKRLSLTNLVVAAPIGGSLQLYYQGANQLERKVIEVRGTSTTSTITPSITSLECTAIDTPLLVRVNTGATDAWAITTEGFDLD